MDETFRLRRSCRNTGIGGLIGFTAWAAFGVYVALTLPNVKDRAAVLAMMGGVPLFMDGISLWCLLAYWRDELTIQGDRIRWRGIVRTREIDLLEVTDARWRPGSIVLRNDATRLTIDFANYEETENDRIIGHLRSVDRKSVV